ncbi:hypothetical protein SBV1_2240026 [Verrucomicrobia bacterium]|nr:hypothetical protein SBV1_2240026 [Verrucomicrobiota bacterium]
MGLPGHSEPGAPIKALGAGRFVWMNREGLAHHWTWVKLTSSINQKPGKGPYEFISLWKASGKTRLSHLAP